jgi:hypothetical protein
MAYKQNGIGPKDPPKDPPKDKFLELIDNRRAARENLRKEEGRVKTVRENIVKVAKRGLAGGYEVPYGGDKNDQRAGVPNGAGLVPKGAFNWLMNSGGMACNSYSCGIMREAGATIPKSGDGVHINGRTYKGGEPMAIIPGNQDFDRIHKKLGFELRPGGSTPEPGDLTRSNHYMGTNHSTIQVGDGKSIYNQGEPGFGLKQSEYYSNPESYTAMTDDQAAGLRSDVKTFKMKTPVTAKDGKIYPERLMRYVGDLPEMRIARRDTMKAAFDGRPIIETKGVQPVGKTETPAIQTVREIVNGYSKKKKGH